MFNRNISFTFSIKPTECSHPGVLSAMVKKAEDGPYFITDKPLDSYSTKSGSEVDINRGIKACKFQTDSSLYLLKDFLEKLPLNVSGNFNNYYSQGPGSNVHGRCFAFLMSAKIGDLDFEKDCPEDSIEPRIKPNDSNAKDFYIEYHENGDLYYETTEVIFLNLFPGNELSQKKCLAKTVCKLTDAGWEVVSWNTNHPILNHALKSDIEALKPYLKPAPVKPTESVSQPQSSLWQRLKQKWNNMSFGRKAATVASSVLFAVGIAATIVGAFACPPSLLLTLPIWGKVGLGALLVHSGAVVGGAGSLGALGLNVEEPKKTTVVVKDNKPVVVSYVGGDTKGIWRSTGVPKEPAVKQIVTEEPDPSIRDVKRSSGVGVSVSQARPTAAHEPLGIGRFR